MTVYRSEVTVLISPLVPYSDAVLGKPLDVGVSFEEPQQLIDNRPDMDLFRGQQRETLG